MSNLPDETDDDLQLKALGKDADDTVVEEQDTNIVEAVDIEVTGREKVTTLADFIKNPQSHVVALAKLIERLLGKGWEDFEYEVISLVLRKNLNAPIHSVNRDKIQALKAVLLSNIYEEDYMAFGYIALSFDEVDVDFSHIPVITVNQAYACIDSIQVLTGKPINFNDEVMAYLEVVHLDEGFTRPLPAYKFIKIDSENFAVDNELVDYYIDKFFVRDVQIGKYLDDSDSAEKTVYNKLVNTQINLNLEQKELKRQESILC